ncbi:TraB/GumN family protein [Phenylobacterium sp. 20VBR1]|uniref:TraB/GumN family protein n=1 Tax=Phenylobacterium glaciei TaxID=2803784 RepID=A0A941CY52_9CAUL|nr:TraB/GumN family protein [Phenylobacterium glaciei]MBR7618014.1 TraB/GumN family protein [Phenylobacterium glaciei]
MFKLGLLALAAFLVSGPALAKPPVWIVRDADSEVLIFGSVHVLPPGRDWRPTKLDLALTAADDLWFELPMGQATEAEIAGLAASKGVLPPDQHLSALLSPAGAAALAKAGQTYGLMPGFLDRLEPWFAEVALAGAQFRAEGADTDSGVEKSINGTAPATAQRRAFETAAQQIALFDEAPVAAQVASLEDSLTQMDKDPDAYDRLIASWMAADTAALEKDALTPLKTASPVLYARLVSDRNAAWTKVLDERLKGHGHTVVVVGVGHLLTADGVPARLRALGYSVEGP